MPRHPALERLDEPDGDAQPSGWRAFWRARALMAADAHSTQPALDTAYLAFVREGDEIGAALTARTAVYALYYAEATYAGLSTWMRRTEWGRLPPADLHDPSARAWWLAGELARVYACDSTEYASASTRAVRDALLAMLLASGAPLDPDASLAAAATLFEYAEFEDDGRLFDQVFASVAPLMQVRLGSPLYRGRAWHRIRGCAAAIGPRRGRGVQRIDAAEAEARAFEEAERHGLGPLRAHLLVTRCFYANIARDEATAERALHALGEVTDFRRPLQAAWYYCLRGQAAARREDATEALLQFRQAVDAAEAAETPINVQQNFVIGLGMALAHAGHWDEAAQRFERLLRELSGRDRAVVEVRLALVDFHRAQAVSPGRVPALRASILAQAQAIRWMSFGLLTPVSSARFLADALREGHAPEFIAQVARQRRLPAEPAYPKSWPWAVRIVELGRLRIEVDDVPVAFGARPPRKPLELLATIVALGPQPVAASTVMDLLWPEADGDKAKSSLDMAVLRLRRLLGHDDALRVEGANLALDRSLAWVDAWSFAEEASVEYGGTLFAGERYNEAIDQARERLCALHVQRTLDRGASLEAMRRHAETREALALYEGAIQHDGLAEALHRGVIRCHLALGDAGSAMRAFLRCRDRLARELGIRPAAATQALVTELAAP